MNFKGKAKRLDDIDLPKLGALIGVGEDEIHAVLEVETSGGGFDSQGRPKMLFEPHVFYRNIRPHFRDGAVKQGLAYQRWGTKPYPKDSYPRLELALQLDFEAALKSCSWGLGQVMGEHHKMLGYENVRDMVQAFMDDEEAHLKGMVDFIIANNIDDDLREHRWEVFARVYNGPGYRKNKYHIKLAKAYEKWKRIKDTPYEPEGQGA